MMDKETGTLKAPPDGVILCKDCGHLHRYGYACTYHGCGCSVQIEKKEDALQFARCTRCFRQHDDSGPLCGPCTSAQNRDTTAPKEEITAAARYGGWAVDEYIAAMNLGFRLGNVVKYVSRAGKKDGATALDDLKKARVYLDRHIERLGEGKP